MQELRVGAPVLTDAVDWTEMEVQAEKIRVSEAQKRGGTAAAPAGNPLLGLNLTKLPRGAEEKRGFALAA